MIALLYARLSADDRDGGVSGSVARQLEEARALALAAGDTIGGEYVDDGISGSLLHRPGIDALLVACRPGVRVWAKNQSRLARDTDHVGYYRVRIREAGAELVCWAEREQSRLEVGVRGVIDEQHVIRCREEALRVLPARARAGRRNGGKPPLGYLPAGDGWTVDLEAAAPVVRAFGLVLQGVPIHQAAIETGQSWQSLRNRLANPIYAGGVAYLRRRHTHTERGTVRQVPRPPAEWIITWGAAPAVVSRDTWERVQAILPSRYRGPRGRYRRTPLSGLLRCGECGSVMRVINTRDPIGYGCRACRAIGSVSVRGWQTAILREVLAYLAGPALEPLCREIAAAYDSGHARGSAEASLARLRRSEARLIEAIADPDAGEVAALAVRLRETQGEIRAAEAALGALPAAITAESVRERIEGLIARLPAIGERAEAAPILAELIERIDVPADRSELRITVAPRVRLAPIPTPCAGRRVVRVRLPVAA